MTRVRTVVFAAVAGLGLMTGVCPVSATTFIDVTVEDLARASDLVVIGRVEHVAVEPHGPAGQPGIHTRALIQVAETLRGEHRMFVEVWVQGGRIGRRMRVVPGQATFAAGEHVGVFLFEAGGGLWPTGMGRGKWAVRSDAVVAELRQRVPGTPTESRTRGYP